MRVFTRLISLKILKQDYLTQAKCEEVSDAGLPLMVGVEVAKMVDGVFGAGAFTGLDGLLPGLFSCVPGWTPGFNKSVFSLPAVQYKNVFKSLMSKTLTV